MIATSEKGSTRGYVAGKYGFELDGISAGWIHSAEGGHATSDVVLEPLGPDHSHYKHISGVKYDEMVIETGTGMSKDFYAWIKKAFTPGAEGHVRKNGAICTCDYNFKELSRLEFTNGLITEVGFPALDAASRDTAKLTVKVAPEFTRTKAGTKQSVSGKYTIDRKVQKRWLPADFKLTIDGLDCTRVSKIGAIILKQKTSENPVGETRGYEREPGVLEVPNLVVTLAESHADSWYRWADDFIITGNNGWDQVKTATLTYLTPNLQEELFTIKCSHVGIFKLTPDRVVSGSDAIRRVTAEMYVERMDVDFHKAWS
jgi:phage tail-like protein